MAKPRRGEIWAVDFEPQTRRAEPGKSRRPALVIQTNALNDAGHSTTIVVPGTTNIETQAPADDFPLRVRVQKTGNLKSDTDLMIDQIRAVASERLGERLCAVTPVHLQRVKEALNLLTR